MELYKKYRATKWSHLIGQERVAKTFVSALKKNAIPTGYMLTGPRGIGKDLHKDTKIPTPTGFTTMGDLKVGDIVLGSDGKPTKVLDKYCPMDPEIYEITFSDRTKVRAGSGHLWETETKNMRDNARKENSRARKTWTTKESLKRFDKLDDLVDRTEFIEAFNMSLSVFIGFMKKNPVSVIEKRGLNKYYNKYDLLDSLKKHNTGFIGDQRTVIRNIVTTAEIEDTLKVRNETNHSVRNMSGAADFELESNSKNLIDPYVLGAWLGDGSKSSGVFYGTGKDAESISAEINRTGFKSSFLRKDKRNNTETWGIYTPQESSLVPVLKEMNLWRNKHIPKSYLFSSEKTRKALLAGLLDTDGSVSKEGTISFSQKNQEIFDSVRILIHSLGHKTTTRFKEINGEFYYELYFRTSEEVFTLERKNNRIRKNLNKRRNSVRRFIVNVEKIKDNPEDYFCITVDSQDSLFLCTESFIPTHNTSSAKILAKALNCEDNKDDNGDVISADPCNRCDTCQNIDTNSQMGVHYISMANAGSVDSVRNIAQQAQLSAPVDKQVWILDEAHNLSKQAWDALLIPLESESMPSLFIFCSTEEEKIPKTILSRIPSRNFTLVDAETLQEHLTKVSKAEDMELSEEQIKEAVRRSRGSVRDALTALETIASSDEEDFKESYTEKMIEALAAGRFHDALIASSEANSEGANFRLLTEQMFSDMRDMVILAAGGDRSLAGIPSVSNPEELAKKMSYANIVRNLDHLGTAMSNITFGADARLHFEIALTKMFMSSKQQRKS